MTARLLPYGPDALLVELDRSDEVAGVAAALRRARLPGVTDIVPAARTVLVRAERGALVRSAVADVVADAKVAPESPVEAVVEVPVVYDGADLAAVAAAAGCSVDEVIERHAAGRYTVAFCGFAPGFAYLTGLDPLLHLPRRPEPRPRVPAGSVAIAAEYTSVYPSASPGGWHLLGRTELVLWDAERTPPALLTPGRGVRFVPRGA
jgi:KipI family sensor histidine kinase inhibitor